LKDWNGMVLDLLRTSPLPKDCTSMWISSWEASPFFFFYLPTSVSYELCFIRKFDFNLIIK